MDLDELLDEYRRKYPPLLLIHEAAEIARVPKQTMYDWSSRGLLDALKVKRGRRVLFLRDAFIRYVIDGTAP